MTRNAFVTLLTSDNYLPGALVVANALKSHNTTASLVVMVTHDIVTIPAIQLLFSTFDHVVYVSTLRSKDHGNLALLGRPELDITFTKFHAWNLLDYDRVVFLDADTVSLRNVDVLFDYLDNDIDFAAAPDIGWPDCFNSGVFVLRPSKAVFEALVEHGNQSGSFDGGDQGLLNSFFNGWGSGKPSQTQAGQLNTARLPFIFNVTPSASYSYLPAYVHYNADLAIVHFIGESKPWFWDRFTDGTIFPKGNVNGRILDLIYQWWRVFDNYNLNESLKIVTTLAHYQAGWNRKHVIPGKVEPHKVGENPHLPIPQPEPAPAHHYHAEVHHTPHQSHEEWKQYIKPEPKPTFYFEPTHHESRPPTPPPNPVTHYESYSTPPAPPHHYYVVEEKSYTPPPPENVHSTYFYNHQYSHPNSYSQESHWKQEKVTTEESSSKWSEAVTIHDSFKNESKWNEQIVYDSIENSYKWNEQIVSDTAKSESKWSERISYDSGYVGSETASQLSEFIIDTTTTTITPVTEKVTDTTITTTAYQIQAPDFGQYRIDWDSTELYGSSSKIHRRTKSGSIRKISVEQDVDLFESYGHVTDIESDEEHSIGVSIFRPPTPRVPLKKKRSNSFRTEEEVERYSIGVQTDSFASYYDSIYTSEYKMGYSYDSSITSSQTVVGEAVSAGLDDDEEIVIITVFENGVYVRKKIIRKKIVTTTTTTIEESSSMTSSSKITKTLSSASSAKVSTVVTTDSTIEVTQSKAESLLISDVSTELIVAEDQIGEMKLDDHVTEHYTEIEIIHPEEVKKEIEYVTEDYTEIEIIRPEIEYEQQEYTEVEVIHAEEKVELEEVQVSQSVTETKSVEVEVKEQADVIEIVEVENIEEVEVIEKIVKTKVEEKEKISEVVDVVEVEKEEEVEVVEKVVETKLEEKKILEVFDIVEVAKVEELEVVEKKVETKVEEKKISEVVDIVEVENVEEVEVIEKIVKAKVEEKKVSEAIEVTEVEKVVKVVEKTVETKEVEIEYQTEDYTEVEIIPEEPVSEFYTEIEIIPPEPLVELAPSKEVKLVYQVEIMPPVEEKITQHYSIEDITTTEAKSFELIAVEDVTSAPEPVSFEVYSIEEDSIQTGPKEYSQITIQDFSEASTRNSKIYSSEEVASVLELTAAEEQEYGVYRVEDEETIITETSTEETYSRKRILQSKKKVTTKTHEEEEELIKTKITRTSKVVTTSAEQEVAEELEAKSTIHFSIEEDVIATEPVESVSYVLEDVSVPVVESESEEIFGVEEITTTTAESKGELVYSVSDEVKKSESAIISVVEDSAIAETVSYSQEEVISTVPESREIYSIEEVKREPTPPTVFYSIQEDTVEDQSSYVYTLEDSAEVKESVSYSVEEIVSRVPEIYTVEELSTTAEPVMHSVEEKSLESQVEYSVGESKTIKTESISYKKDVVSTAYETSTRQTIIQQETPSVIDYKIEEKSVEPVTQVTYSIGEPSVSIEKEAIQVSSVEELPPQVSYSIEKSSTSIEKEALHVSSEPTIRYSILSDSAEDFYSAKEIQTVVEPQPSVFYTIEESPKFTYALEDSSSDSVFYSVEEVNNDQIYVVEDVSPVSKEIITYSVEGDITTNVVETKSVPQIVEELVSPESSTSVYYSMGDVNVSSEKRRSQVYHVDDVTVAPESKSGIVYRIEDFNFSTDTEDGEQPQSLAKEKETVTTETKIAEGFDSEKSSNSDSGFVEKFVRKVSNAAMANESEEQGEFAEVVGDDGVKRMIKRTVRKVIRSTSSGSVDKGEGEGELVEVVGDDGVKRMVRRIVRRVVKPLELSDNEEEMVEEVGADGIKRMIRRVVRKSTAQEHENGSDEEGDLVEEVGPDGVKRLVRKRIVRRIIKSGETSQPEEQVVEEKGPDGRIIRKIIRRRVVQKTVEETDASDSDGEKLSPEFKKIDISAEKLHEDDKVENTVETTSDGRRLTRKIVHHKQSDSVDSVEALSSDENFETIVSTDAEGRKVIRRIIRRVVPLRTSMEVLSPAESTFNNKATTTISSGRTVETTDEGEVETIVETGADGKKTIRRIVRKKVVAQPTVEKEVKRSSSTTVTSSAVSSEPAVVVSSSSSVEKTEDGEIETIVETMSDGRKRIRRLVRRKVTTTTVKQE